MALLTVRQAAERLTISSAVLYNRPFRAKLGLRGVKLGGALRFVEADVEMLIEDKKEDFGPRPNVDESA
jgi:predicted DNA-binding transcriptional regulator AlpA